MIVFLNALNLITVLAGFLVQILIIRFFGASDATDIYYLVLTVSTFVTGLSTGFLTDLFVPFYHDAKNRTFAEAQNLSGSVLTLSLAAGLIGGVAVYVLAPFIVTAFASGFSPDKASMASDMLRIVAFSVPWATLTVALNSTLNANSFLLATYLTNLIPPALNVAALIVGGSTYGITALMVAAVVASFVVFAVIFVYCKFKVGARFANPFDQRDLGRLLVKNVPVRMTNIVNLLRGPVTTTVLSFFPAGILTLYGYAEKLMTVMLGTANSPLTQLHYVRSSEYAARSAYDEMKQSLVLVTHNSAILFGALFLVALTVFEPAFGILFGDRVASPDIHTMFILFLALFPFSYSVLLGAPMSATGLAMKKGRIGLYASFVFIVVLGLTVLPLVKTLAIYGLPISAFIAQACSVGFYAFMLNRIVPLVDASLLEPHLTTILIGLTSMVVNMLYSSGPIVSFGINAGLLILWVVINRKSAITALAFVTTRGEVK